jgi:hypothetical protein
MRAALALLAAGLGLAAAADPPRRTAAVDVEGVEVRAGQAMNFPATGKLRKGETVIIIREEETGFCAIQPPPGSVSWVKQIHIGRAELGENGRTNVAVMVDGADVLAGSDKASGPIKRITTRLPKGTIVEVVGPMVRVEDSSWYPITPPEGDLRWVPKNALQSGSITSLAPPPTYVRPDPPAFTVSDGSKGPDTVARPAAAALPRALTDHRRWAEATQADKAGDYAKAKDLYARIYQDLWDQKAERDAIVICYNRYTRCDEFLRRGEGVPARRSESRREPAAGTNPDGTAGGKWSGPGKLQELQRVFVDGQPVYSLQDDRGNVIYYVTAVNGINLRAFNDKRVQLYGAVSQRPELYRPHLAAEKVEVAK